MSVARIIDANTNRAREALRVMEEAARFIINDAALTRSLKNLRHDLCSLAARFDGVEFDRDVAGDVGAAISTPRELTRATAREVVMAAGRRLGEALRAIEEYGKVLDAAAALEVERLRYTGYALEQRLIVAFGAGSPRQWKVCVLLSERLCPDGDWAAVARAVTAAGADCIQLREKDVPDAELLRRTRQLVEIASPGTAVVVNDRPDIALLGGADGVHVGQGDLPCRSVRRLVGRRLLVGVSTSRLAEAMAALADGADYCGVGPMHVSTTTETRPIAGPAYLRDYLEWNRLPHLAIGGIDPERGRALAALGCRGIAVSAAVCAASDPAAVVSELLAVFGGD